MAKFIVLFKHIGESCFHPQLDWSSLWVFRLWTTGLWITGLAIWGQFFRWGDIPFDLLDWSDITAPRLLFIQDALQRGILPLHTQSPEAMKGVTDRFLAIPDLLLSPQVIFLKITTPQIFLLINFTLLYTIGFAGLLRIQRRHKLGTAVFTILFLLFNLNGHIVGHLANGHITWMAYFFWPYFYLLILDLFEQKPTWDWVFRMSVLSLLIFLQGGFHQFVILLMFMGLLGLFTRGLRRACLAAILSSIAVCIFRILPASLVVNDLKLEYLGGFTTIHEILRGMVTLVEPHLVLENVSSLNHYIGWWEFDYYIGWAGLAFIIIALAYSIGRKSPNTTLMKAVFWPAMILAVLSVGRLYKIIFQFQIPLLSSERVGSRFLIIPFLFALFFAAREAQSLLDRYQQRTGRAIPGKVQFFSLLWILLLFNDLIQHTELWGLTNVAKAILPVPIDPTLWVVANRPDPVYTGILAGSLLFSVISLAVLLYLRRSKPEANLGTFDYSA